MASLFSALFRTPSQVQTPQEQTSQEQTAEDAAIPAETPNSQPPLDKGKAKGKQKRVKPVDLSLYPTPKIDHECYRRAAEAQRSAAEEALAAHLENEEIKHRNIPKRWNLSISPDDDAFQDVLDFFRRELADPNKSINDVFEANFTSHEQSLIHPADKKRDPALAKLQAINRKRFNKLLAGQKFKNSALPVDMPFSLTLLYFGLPIAPRTFGPRLTMGITSDTDDDVVDEKELNEPEGGHLRFLNAYHSRLHNNDLYRGKTISLAHHITVKANETQDSDSLLEAYYGFDSVEGIQRRYASSLSRPKSLALTLRGGELPDLDDTDQEISSETLTSPSSDLDSEMSVTVTADHDMGDGTGNLCLRGGKYTSLWPGILGQVEEHAYRGRMGAMSDVRPTKSLLHRSDGNHVTSGTWVPLYGAQGIVWFDLDDMETFVDAVDRLLCLDTRAGITYTLSIYDREADYTDADNQEAWDNAGFAESFTCAGEGDYTSDIEGLKWLKGTIPAGEDPQDWAIYISAPGESFPVWYWDPSLAGEDVACFVMDWEDGRQDRPDVAYLHMPDNCQEITATNIYQPWMAHVIRILSPGRLFHRPGKPVIPDTFFSLVAPVNAQDALLYSYGGLNFPPRAWASITHDYAKESVRVFNLIGRHWIYPGSGLVPNSSFNIFMPGYNKNIDLIQPRINHCDVDDPSKVWMAISNVVRHSMSDHSYQLVNSIEVYMPGDSFFLRSRKTLQTIEMEPTRGNNPELLKPDPQSLKTLSDLLVQWRDWSMENYGLDNFPQFITIRPIYHTTRVFAAADPDKTADYEDCDNLFEYTISDFMDLIERLWSNRHPLGAYDRSYLALSVKQHDFGLDTASQQEQKALARVNDTKPEFLITPETSEAEWELLRRQLVVKNLFVDIVDQFSCRRGWSFLRCRLLRYILISSRLHE